MLIILLLLIKLANHIYSLLYFIFYYVYFLVNLQKLELPSTEIFKIYYNYIKTF